MRISISPLWTKIKKSVDLSMLFGLMWRYFYVHSKQLLLDHCWAGTFEAFLILLHAFLRLFRSLFRAHYVWLLLRDFVYCGDSKNRRSKSDDETCLNSAFLCVLWDDVWWSESSAAAASDWDQARASRCSRAGWVSGRDLNSYHRRILLLLLFIQAPNLSRAFWLSTVNRGFLQVA